MGIVWPRIPEIAANDIIEELKGFAELYRKKFRHTQEKIQNIVFDN